MSALDRLQLYLSECPLIAIIRGVTPQEAEAIGDALFDAGIRIIEVPLNSPEPLQSIERLSARLGDRALVGAGTVLKPHHDAIAPINSHSTLSDAEGIAPCHQPLMTKPAAPTTFIP